MLLRDLDLFLVELPLSGQGGCARSVVVWLLTTEGQEGWGEAPCRWRVGELGPRRELLLSVLSGRSIFETEDLASLDLHGDPSLAAALEMACWDAIGRSARQPLCHLWGGRYRSHVPIAARIAAQPLESAVMQIREWVEQGCHALLLTASGNVERDVELVRTAAELAGDAVELQLDGRQAFTRAEARQLCRELESVNLKYLLDPTPAPAWDLLASLARETNLPLAASAGIVGPEAMLALARAGEAAAAVVDPHRVGGWLRTRKCAAVAEAARLPMAVASASPLGLSMAAMLHLVAATPSLVTAQPSQHHLLPDDLLIEPLELAHGMLTVPSGPGLGVEIDRAKLETYRAR